MEPEPLDPSDETNGQAGASKPWYALAVIVAALAIAAGGIVAVRPYVLHRLEVRTSYRQLKESRNGDAVRWLIRHGENPDETLLEMLDGDERDRFFAARHLSERPTTPEITAEALRILEERQLIQQVGDTAIAARGGRSGSTLYLEADYTRCLIRILERHADTVDGAITETDERIIAILNPALTPSNVLQSEAASVLAAYLPLRPDLHDPLRPSVGENYLYGAMKVSRGYYRADPANFDAYLQVLLKGIASNSSYERERALLYLSELGPTAHDAIPHLQSLREEHPGFAPEIDRTLLAIEGSSPEAN